MSFSSPRRKEKKKKRRQKKTCEPLTCVGSQLSALWSRCTPSLLTVEARRCEVSQKALCSFWVHISLSPPLWTLKLMAGRGSNGRFPLQQEIPAMFSNLDLSAAKQILNFNSPLSFPTNFPTDLKAKRG